MRIITKSSSETLLSMRCNSSCSFLSFEICSTMSNPSSAVILNNARRVASTPSLPRDSLTKVSCSHIARAVSAPMMWIISASLMLSSILVRVFASPSSHFVSAVRSSAVGFSGSTDPGRVASFAIYFSSPRSRNTASILRFHGIQLLAFSNSIR